MVVLVTCKNREDPLKLKALECKSMEIFKKVKGSLLSSPFSDLAEI